MRVLLSRAEPDMIHAFLTKAEGRMIREALRKDKSPHIKEFRLQLKKAINDK